MTHKLPLFPLGLVLFPNAPLPLHIFEERYQEMVGRCVEQNEPFGVVLLTDGIAESSEVIFRRVGTTAQISDGVRLDDGRYIINTVGQRRFRIQQLLQKKPYYIGDVTFLEDEPGDLVSKQADELRTIYTQYWQAITAATGVSYEPETLPDDPIEVTYWMAHQIQVENEQKQRWLENGVELRLREMIASLRAEMALLPERPGGPFEGGWTGTGSWN